MKKTLETTDVKIGNKVEKTTNFLKNLSNYIEHKLYDESGEVKNGGVRSLSLTFAMLVGFSTAILVVSSIFISMIIINKNEIIYEKTSQIKSLKEDLINETKNSKYWEKRYNNVYAKCDSIGYERARQALEFSQSINNKLLSEKKEINSKQSSTKSELNSLQKISDDLTNINNTIK